MGERHRREAQEIFKYKVTCVKILSSKKIYGIMKSGAAMMQKFLKCKGL